MISGTSKNWSKSGPVDLLTVTKMLQILQENMEHAGENIIVVRMGLKKICFFLKKMCVIVTMCLF